MKKLSRESVPAVLVRNGVTALCAHTNLDKARGGVCETLAQQLGLRNIRPGEDFLYFGNWNSRCRWHSGRRTCETRWVHRLPGREKRETVPDGSGWYQVPAEIFGRRHRRLAQTAW